MTGAGNGTRTRDFNLGKVALYQLSYSRSKGPRSDPARRCRASLDVSRGSGVHGNEETRPRGWGITGIPSDRTGVRSFFVVMGQNLSFIVIHHTRGSPCRTIDPPS